MDHEAEPGKGLRSPGLRARRVARHPATGFFRSLPEAYLVKRCCGCPMQAVRIATAGRA
jgi:hypothetical protein